VHQRVVDPRLDGSTTSCGSHSTVVEEVVQLWPPNKEQAGTSCLVAESALRVAEAQAVEVPVADLEAETLRGGISSYPLLHGPQSRLAPQRSIRAECLL